MIKLAQSYKDTEASMGGDFRKLPAGGYICRIIQVEDVPEKEYVKLVYDIAEGEFKGYYSDDFGKNHPNMHTYFASYKEANLGRFKGVLKAIDESNNTTFVKDAENGLNEQLLVNKYVGLLIGYEEYNTDRGETKEVAKPRIACSVERIKKGDFKVPELKKLPASKSQVPQGFIPYSDNDVPF